MRPEAKLLAALSALKQVRNKQVLAKAGPRWQLVLESSREREVTASSSWQEVSIHLETV